MQALGLDASAADAPAMRVAGLQKAVTSLRETLGTKHEDYLSTLQRLGGTLSEAVSHAVTITLPPASCCRQQAAAASKLLPPAYPSAHHLGSLAHVG